MTLKISLIFTHACVKAKTYFSWDLIVEYVRFVAIFLLSFYSKNRERYGALK